MSIADKLKTVAQKMEDVYRTGLFKYAPKLTASGESILLENSAPEPFVSMTVHGKSWQNGTPTPSTPIEIESAKEVKVLGKNILPPQNVNVFLGVTNQWWDCVRLSFTFEKGKTYTVSFDTPNDNCKFYVNTNSGFDYYEFDGNGQRFSFTQTFTEDVILDNGQFISLNNASDVGSGEFTNFQIELNEYETDYEPYKEPQTLTLPYEINGADGVYDEVDFERKKFIQRWLRFRPNKTLVFDSEHADTPNRYALYLPVFMDNYQPFAEVNAFCSRANWSAWGIEDGSFFIANDGLWYHDLSKTIDEVNAQFAEFGTDIEFVAQLLEPIETDLTDEQIYAFKRLRANSPNTTIVGQGQLDVTYIVDNR